MLKKFKSIANEQHGVTKKKRGIPKGRDAKNNFDPITATPSGGTIWRDYDNPGRPVVTRGDELPQDLRARREKEKKEERRGAKE